MARKLQFWLNYLENLHLRSIDLELGRMQRVAANLNIQQPSCPVVTVAGTNGKGSVVGFLEALYVNAGYNVAAYTSPYLISFNEQFRFNQQWITDEKLSHYFEKIDQARGDITLTYFEFKTLAALLYFSELALDVMILEVGLGGRLDSVNIINPDIAVITSISLDHCDWLGNTRELIAREKAGIFRSEKPAVCGDLNPPATIQETADRLNVPIYYRNKDFFIIENKDGSWNFSSKYVDLKNLPRPFLLKNNIATALQVAELLSLAMTEKIIRETIANTKVPGRLQIISEKPFIVVDVSHNEDSVRQLANFLENHQQKKVTAVFSVLKTKDFSSMAQRIHPYIDVWHIAPLELPLAMPLEQMKAVLQTLGIKNITVHKTILAAYHAARASDAQAIAVFGSFHVAGEVLNAVNGVSIFLD